jgi:hypothetical protein
MSAGLLGEMPKNSPSSVGMRGLFEVTHEAWVNYLGAMIMIMRRPSILGSISILAMSSR